MRRPAPAWLLAAVLLAAAPVRAGTQAADEAAYTLQRGDRVEVTVFGHADLSGPLTLDGAGAVALPIGGTVQAEGVSAAELERRITETLADGFIIRPRVSVRIAEMRPVYVLGAVRNAGAVPYRPGMTALAAIALAGGLTSAQQDTPALRSALLESEQRLEMLLTQRLAVRARIARLVADRDELDAVEFPADLVPTAAAAPLLTAERAVRATEREALAGQLALWLSRLSAAQTELAALGQQVLLEKAQLQSVSTYHADLAKLHRRGLVDRRRLVEMQMEESRIRANLARLDTEIGRADQTIKEVPLRLTEIRAAARQRALAGLQESEARLAELDTGIRAARTLAADMRGRTMGAGGDGTLVLSLTDLDGAGPYEIREASPLRPGDVLRVAAPPESLGAVQASSPVPLPPLPRK